MKLLQINTVINSCSTGHIAEEIGIEFNKNGGESFIAYGRGNKKSKLIKIKIGNKISILLHVFITRLFDLHGFASYYATKKLIRKINKIKPDVIQLHNIHGYYINIKVLFSYLKKINIPIFWTLHDCWAYTGHCSYYTAEKCNKWMTLCCKCPQKKQYPKSFFLDLSRRNFLIKKKLFSNVKELTIITPSEWLSSEVKKSFLKQYPIKVINNGIDLSIFKYTAYMNIDKKKYCTNLSDKMILGVANVWEERKGLSDFLKLAKELSSEYHIVLVGLSEKQLKTLPKNIIGLKKTDSQTDLAKLYSMADVFVNPTHEDNFPTTNIESLACGTPVVTYNIGGAPETINELTGIVVEYGDCLAMKNAIVRICSNKKEIYKEACITRARTFFDSNKKYKEYYDLYMTKLLNKKDV